MLLSIKPRKAAFLELYQNSSARKYLLYGSLGLGVYYTNKTETGNLGLCKKPVLKVSGSSTGWLAGHVSEHGVLTVADLN